MTTLSVRALAPDGGPNHDVSAELVVPNVMVCDPPCCVEIGVLYPLPDSRFLSVYYVLVARRRSYSCTFTLFILRTSWLFLTSGQCLKQRVVVNS